ncbi:lysylphosphatidylglycerol synthase transmembrane domain-containing protein [uncultured Thermanaerothrix sp.]|uniref:lysylphosphatidylglycerol synthase transmembrane domain-containing protein n=1 Tax=uncultured Thermanaerothrix sp. TaxID=1195149 RepID=UPI00262D2D5F|nr:lysylphosphatidylglycerol synthase transmembrane domain-containing protein [uncultured Thermanaerothrix sp.]
MIEPGFSKKSSTKRFSPWRVAGTLLGLGLTVYLLFSYGVDEFIQTLQTVPFAVFALAFGLTLLSRFMVTLRWLALLRSAGVRMGLRRALRLVFMGLFASNFLPTTVGGDAVRLVGVLRHELSASAGVASLVMDRVVGSVGMATLLPWGIPMIWSGMAHLLSAQWLGGMLLTSFSEVFHRGFRLLKGVFDTIGVWLKHPRGIALALLATYGHMGCTFLAAWVLLTSMGQSISLLQVGALWSLAYFITLIPISINGLGVQEFSIAYLYTHFGGVEPQAGMVLAALMRLLYMLASLPGALFLPELAEGLKSNKN